MKFNIKLEKGEYLDAIKHTPSNQIFLFDNLISEKHCDQIVKELQNLVEELPEDQKEVLMMRLYRDMSFKEIAENTNVSINTALGRMRYSIINLRKLVEENEIVLE